jgi:uncharacterized protein
VAGFDDAEIEAALPKAAFVAKDVVAKNAVDGLAAGKSVIVPGALNRVLGTVSWHLPRRLVLPMVSSRHPAMKKT